MKKIFNTQTIIILVICFAPMLLHAQSSPSDPGTDPDTAPIDGGLSLLIASGVGYGVKRIRNKKKDSVIDK